MQILHPQGQASAVVPVVATVPEVLDPLTNTSDGQPPPAEHGHDLAEEDGSNAPSVGFSMMDQMSGLGEGSVHARPAHTSTSPQPPGTVQ
jgi:hypothetical protein